MSIGPMNSIAASVAGAPLAQSHASHSGRVSQDVSAQQLQALNAEHAEQAEGVGTTDGEDTETSDRDADGRRLWEAPPKTGRKSAGLEPRQQLSKDVTGEAGQTLDLSG
jgi:hypothetical protein